MTENKDFSHESKKWNQIEAWILKEKEKKDFEERVINTLRTLNSRLTKKEVIALFNKIEVSKWLDWLRQELEKEIKIWNSEISEEMLKNILDLIKESKEITLKWIEELKIDLTKVLNKSKSYDVDKRIYLSNKYKFIKKLEESELWKNIIIDIAWISIWVLDSAWAIFKLLIDLIKDLMALPGDIIKSMKK